jgi:hypothetical protein
MTHRHDDILAFLEVVKAGGFTAAGRRLLLACVTLICGVFQTSPGQAHHDPLLQAAFTRYLDNIYFNERYPDNIVKWPRRVKVVFGGSGISTSEPLQHRLRAVLRDEIAPATGISFVEGAQSAPATLHIILSNDPWGDFVPNHWQLFPGDSESERRKAAGLLTQRVDRRGKSGRRDTCTAQLFARRGNIESAVILFNLAVPRLLDYCVNASFLLVSGFRQTVIGMGLLSVFNTNPPTLSANDRDVLKALYLDPRVIAGTPQLQAMPILLDAVLHPARQERP